MKIKTLSTLREIIGKGLWLIQKSLSCGMVLCVLFVQARTINVADHGIVPGKDVVLELNHLLESLAGEENIILYFPKGRYLFYPENAIEKYWPVTNHDNSLKRMAFPIFGMKGFTLDGGGSTFVFHGLICPVVLFDTEGVILKNYNIDWDTPFHHELRVVERDEKNKSIVAEVYPKKYGFDVKGGQLYLKHYNWESPRGQNITWDSSTHAPIWQTGQYVMKKQVGKITRVNANRVCFQNASRTLHPIGSVIVDYGIRENRLVPSIHLHKATNTTIENVTVYAAGGMALIAERCKNVYLNRFIVTSTDERTISARADATHFLGCKGEVKLENCLFEHMLDDGINVHGAYVKVVEYKGENTFLCEISHGQQLGFTFCEPGDKVMITSRETVLPIFETEVSEVKVLNEARFLVKVTKLPELMPEGLLSLENLTWYPDVVMKNNIIRDNRARSVLISTKGKVLIEGNMFSSQMHGILIEGDNKSWYESGGVRDVTINNNVFENIGYGTGEYYPLYVSPMLMPEQRLGDDQYHWNIKFTNNKIKSFNGLVAHVRSVKGLVLSENKIELSDKYPQGCTLPAIDLDYCRNVTIENNEFMGFDWPIRLAKKGNTINVKQIKNIGLEE